MTSQSFGPEAPPSSTAFRAALGMFATGVTIVTAQDPQGRPVGLTANSFNSVSLTPPLVLWSLGVRAGSLPVFAACTHYAINILSASQHALAERFSQRHENRFLGVDWTPGLGGAPVLAGACAVFECTNRSRYQEGDHVIFVGEVLACRRQADSSPLLFHGGRYYTELPL